VEQRTAPCTNGISFDAFHSSWVLELAGFHKTAARLACGMISLMISPRFAAVSGTRPDKSSQVAARLGKTPSQSHLDKIASAGRDDWNRPLVWRGYQMSSGHQMPFKIKGRLMDGGASHGGMPNAVPEQVPVFPRAT
jgi:hypothetical protein